MGAGTNRMNRYTVGKATKGYGQYLLNKFGKDECAKRGVAVAYDVRNNSEAFAAVTAADGWCAVCVDGFALGAGKVSGGRIKNHYPKGLRTV